MNKTGYFIFSLDTELGTGYFDHDSKRKRLFSPDGSRERDSIAHLISLFEEYQIIGTWAVVGHIFHPLCEKCEVCPILNWKGKYSSFDEVYGTNHPLWYGADVVDAILKMKPSQEIASHGYTHEVFDENQMSEKNAQIQIREWVRVARQKGISAQSIVFPRNVIGHLKVLKDAGFSIYRGHPLKPLLLRSKTFGRYFKALDQLLSISKVPIYEPVIEETQGMINLRASQNFFDLNRRFELILDSLNLHNLRLNRVIKGIERAAKEKKIIHIWSHPWEFRTEKDFIKLRFVLDAVAQQVNTGQMRSVGMTEMVSIIHDQSTISLP